jgi:hypothetical protein
MTSSNNPTAIFKELMKDYVSLGLCAFALVSKSGDVLDKSIGWPVFEKTFKKHFEKNHLPELLKMKNGKEIFETKVDDFIVKYKLIINYPNKQGSFAAFAIPQTAELQREVTHCELFPLYFPFE